MCGGFLMNKVKIGYGFLIIIFLLTTMSCIQKKETVNNINSEISNVNTEITEENENLKIIDEYYSDENDVDDYHIPDTLEEALEIMNKLKVENIVLEIITINGETYIVVEVAESVLTVGTDVETNIYDIPDKSGNIIFTIPYKNEIQATAVAIIEEPSLPDWGVGMEHWVKIRMEDGTIGWVRGEYTGINRGGIKYRTQKNIWLWENYMKHWI
jgi:Tfp pilus assembly protein PilP